MGKKGAQDALGKSELRPPWFQFLRPRNFTARFAGGHGEHGGKETDRKGPGGAKFALKPKFATLIGEGGAPRPYPVDPAHPVIRSLLRLPPPSDFIRPIRNIVVLFLKSMGINRMSQIKSDRKERGAEIALKLRFATRTGEGRTPLP